MKVVRCDRELELPLVDQALRDWGHDLVLLPENVGEQELCLTVSDCELLLMCYTTINAQVIDAAPQLKGIVKYGVGIDAIDISTAHARGVEVVNIPAYAEETVAECAFSMLLALAKKLPALKRAMTDQGWVWPTSRWLGEDIAGKTLGIVGCGRIGTAMARMANAGFRANVVGFDPNKSSSELWAQGIEKCDDLRTMLSICDFVSLHLTLSESTRGLIGAAELAVMKSSAIVINTARGALVDENALLQALKEKRIAGVGLDVYSQEPLQQENHYLSELYGMDNVILLPHLAFYTAEAMHRLETETLDRCREIIEGRPVTILSSDPRLQKL